MTRPATPTTPDAPDAPTTPDAPDALVALVARTEPMTIIDGIAADAVAAAVRTCPAVEGLSAGSPGEVATYLPGHRVIGVQIAPDVVLVQVRSRWGVPVGEVAAQIRRAVAPLARRRVDVVIGDVGDPPE